MENIFLSIARSSILSISCLTFPCEAGCHIIWTVVPHHSCRRATRRGSRPFGQNRHSDRRYDRCSISFSTSLPSQGSVDVSIAMVVQTTKLPLVLASVGVILFVGALLHQMNGVPPSWKSSLGKIGGHATGRFVYNLSSSSLNSY